MIKQFTFLTLICTSLILTSCGPSAADKVGDAQLCLDTATASTVSSCVDKVAGLETSGAYLVRCSANFIQKGTCTSRDWGALGFTTPDFQTMPP